MLPACGYVLERKAKVKHRFRLTRSIDFKRVRNQGKSFAHPLVVLVKLPASGEHLRVGISTSRAVGNAVQRNRAKRLLRETMRPLLPLIRPGWDLVLIARDPLLKAPFNEIKLAITGLLQRSALLMTVVEDGSHVR